MGAGVESTRQHFENNNTVIEIKMSILARIRTLAFTIMLLIMKMKYTL